MNKMAFLFIVLPEKNGAVFTARKVLVEMGQNNGLIWAVDYLLLRLTIRIMVLPCLFKIGLSTASRSLNIRIPLSSARLYLNKGFKSTESEVSFMVKGVM